MTILAIETSTPHASLALSQRDEICWESEFTSERAHNSRIFAPLEEALKRCERRIDLVVVGIGPGSYGGVRVGIAVANGLSLALGARTIGLSSLEAVSDLENYAVIGDARRKSLFLATVRNCKLAAEPDLLSEEDLIGELTGLSQREIPVFTSDPKLAARHAGVRLAYPSGRRLAELADGLTEAELSSLTAKPLEPHYLRAPFITTPKK